MAERKYSDEQIRKEITETIAANPDLKQCVNCTHYCRVTSDCEVIHMKMFPYIAGCNGRHFETNEELLVRKAKEELDAQYGECEKIENLLALSVTTANSATCFLADLEKRIMKIRKVETDPKRKRDLKKDLDLVDSMTTGMRMIEEELSDMKETMEKHLAKVDSFYRWYIEPHVNRMFSDNGELDVSKSDGHLNNSMEFCRVLASFTKKCICNEENCNKVFGLLDSLKNDAPYGLTDKDIAHYKLR